MDVHRRSILRRDVLLNGNIVCKASDECEKGKCVSLITLRA